jgi:hypothetical protein
MLYCIPYTTPKALSQLGWRRRDEEGVPPNTLDAKDFVCCLWSTTRALDQLFSCTQPHPTRHNVSAFLLVRLSFISMPCAAVTHLNARAPFPQHQSREPNEDPTRNHHAPRHSTFGATS